MLREIVEPLPATSLKHVPRDVHAVNPQPGLAKQDRPQPGSNPHIQNRLARPDVLIHQAESDL